VQQHNNSTSKQRRASSTSPLPTRRQKSKVGPVTDIGGSTTGSFNAWPTRASDAEKQLGVTARSSSRSPTPDYVPNLSTLATQSRPRHRVGFLMADTTEKVAKKFPNVKFAIVVVPDMRASPKTSRACCSRSRRALPGRLPVRPLRKGQQRQGDRQNGGLKIRP